MDRNPEDVIVAGIGQTAVGEHWERSLRQLATEAILAARKDAGGLVPEVLYIGNMLGVSAARQANLGALLTEEVGLVGVEGVTVEAADASGGAALRMAYLAVRSGAVRTALAVGVEKVTDIIGGESEALIAHILDADYEAAEGLTPVSLAELLFHRYLIDYGADRDALGGFPENAHANGASNPCALYQQPLRPGDYSKAARTNNGFNLFDIAPYADGAAAVLLTRRDHLPESWDKPPVSVIGSSLVTDTLSIHDRHQPLVWDAARLSVERACLAAGILPGEADFFELHDATTLHAVLSLEAAGFASQGQGWKLGVPEVIGLNGQLPVGTFGGLKARGHTLGASGIYQAVEATLQLRGQAGPNQVPDAKLGLIQCLGGMASTAATHVLAVGW
jgi:acetyl-CoA C-acetyltransferase